MTGKVAFITGAARGQGRAHAIKLASEGADIIAVDICDQMAGVPYPMATTDDLAATVKLVEDTGARIVAREADVRDRAALKAVLAPLHTDQSPFHPALPRPETKDVTYVRPELVGEVRYSEMTSDGRLRHPSWRGLRPDKSPGDVVVETEN